MESTIPLLFAAVVGFGHAFEADHLVAVSTIATKRKHPIQAIKDGIFWGLGHTSTIFLIGLIMIVGKVAVSEVYFGYFEAAVGMMLIGLGLVRLYQYYNGTSHVHRELDGTENHHLAYGVGLVHGLAGSGAMILLVMTEIQTTFNSLLYLLIFGVGSIVGMLLAAGVFSLPFSKRFTSNRQLQLVLIVLSSLLCIGYGAFVVYENLA
ncbi:MAG: urease accessory protein [Bacteroidota bacterium]